MEPVLHTAPELEGILEELRQREPIFHRPLIASTRGDFEKMTDVDYWEVGASGRRYSREFVLDTVENRAPDPNEASWITRDFHVREVARDNYLVTYTLEQGERVSRRATLWRRTHAGWKILYHQGTLVQQEA